MRCVFVVAACALALTHAEEACSKQELSEEALGQELSEEALGLADSLLQTLTTFETGTHKEHPEEPLPVDDGSADDGTERRPDKFRKIYQEYEKRGRNFTWLWSRFGEELRSLVPKDLKPAALETLRSLNETAGASLAAVGATEGYYPKYVDGFKAFCGSSKRFDVAGYMQQSLNLEACYLFSCVPFFIVSSKCGGSFYTNGGGNCKCCGEDSNYYNSNSNNVVYMCR